MKLKTEFQDEDFKLGEVADVNIATMPDGRIKAQAVAKSGGVHTFFYDDLKTFTDDWEDVPEEPKDFWFIDPEILIACESTDPLLCDKKVAIETMKQIGNYFDSREEAKKAVEKLKAWKRLKDKGFEFNGFELIEGKIRFVIDLRELEESDLYKDLILLFGKE